MSQRLMQEKQRIALRPWVLSLLLLPLLALLAIAGYRIFTANWDQMLKSNLARTTTATVREKREVIITEQEPYYVNDLDDRIQERPGTRQFRVYYEIDNFDQVSEPKRTELIKSEQDRVREYGRRFRAYSENNRELYDRTQVGDKLEIHYRYIGDKKEVLSIENLTHRPKD